MKTLISILMVSLCLCAKGQVVIYKYLETGTVTGNFQSYKVNYSGYIILDVQTGLLSGVQTLTSSKKYFDLDLSMCDGSAVKSSKGQYTVYSAALTRDDDSGNPIRNLVWLKGVNSLVYIGAPISYNVPKTFQMLERQMKWQDGEQQMEEDSGTMKFDLTRSYVSNQAGDDPMAAADRIKAYLRTLGYSQG